MPLNLRRLAMLRLAALRLTVLSHRNQANRQPPNHRLPPPCPPTHRRPNCGLPTLFLRRQAISARTTCSSSPPRRMPTNESPLVPTTFQIPARLHWLRLLVPAARKLVLQCLHNRRRPQRRIFPH